VSIPHKTGCWRGRGLFRQGFVAAHNSPAGNRDLAYTVQHQQHPRHNHIRRNGHWGCRHCQASTAFFGKSSAAWSGCAVDRFPSFMYRMSSRGDSPGPRCLNIHRKKQVCTLFSWNAKGAGPVFLQLIQALAHPRHIGLRARNSLKTSPPPSATVLSLRLPVLWPVQLLPATTGKGPLETLWRPASSILGPSLV